MRHKLYSVYDAKAEAYLPPFLQRTKAEAIRSFSASVNNPDSALYQSPADFMLVELAEWDELKGTIVPHPHAQSIGSAMEFKKQLEIDPNQLTLNGVSQLQPQTEKRVN